MTRKEAVANAQKALSDSQWGWEFTPDRTADKLREAEDWMRLAELLPED